MSTFRLSRVLGIGPLEAAVGDAMQPWRQDQRSMGLYVARNWVHLGEHFTMMKQLLSLPLLVFVMLVAPLQAIAQQQPPQTAPQPPYVCWPGPWHTWSGGFHLWWICPLMMLFMFLIFGIIFFFVRRADGSHHWGPPWHMMHGAPPTHTAMQILNERFARGEIQKDEYEQKKATILSGALH